MFELRFASGRLLRLSAFGFTLLAALALTGCGASNPSTSESGGSPPAGSSAAPTVSSISPASVPAGSAGFTLTVNGGGFTTASVVQVGGVSEPTTYVSAQQLQAAVSTAQVAASASLQVVVANGAATSGTAQAPSLAVTPPAAAATPAISSLSPSTVPAAAAATISIQGAGFVSGSVAQWNGSARPTTVASASLLTVALTAADLASPGAGKITVSNPDGSVSPAATLTITAAATGIVIENVTLKSTPNGGGCDQIQATITGANFPFLAAVQVNGTTLPVNSVYSFAPGTIVATVPFLSGVSQLTFTIADTNSTARSAPYAYPATAPPLLAVCATPDPASIYPGTGFQATLQAFAINIAATPTVTLGALPAGVTTPSTGSLAIPPAGALVQFKAAASVAAGSYSVLLNAVAGGSTDTAVLALTVPQGTPPSISWVSSLANETDVTIGSSAQRQLTLQAFPAVDYTVTPSVSGLPTGVTASISPATLVPGQTTTLTLQAAANAPVSMNTTVTVTGTAAASVSAATTTFLLDITDAPGTRPDNGTDFTPTGGTPYAAVYDAAHQHIFASNPDWGRVDVLDAQTHTVIRELNIRDPRGLDLAPDGSKLWVATGSRLLYSVDPTTFAMTAFELPLYANASYPTGSWEDVGVFALADGTVMLGIEPAQNEGIDNTVVWNPATNALTSIAAQNPLARSGNGTFVYFDNQNSENCQFSVYSTATQALSNGPNLTTGCGFYAVNSDGSRLVLANNQGFALYDGSFNVLGSLPAGSQVGVTPGFLFSPDSSILYELMSNGANTVIATINASTLAVVGTAPAVATLPVGVSETPIGSSFFGLSGNGLLLGVQDFGVSFEDPTFFQHYAAAQSGVAYPVFVTPDSGPLTGGTVSTPYGDYPLTPDVWYGGLRGMAAVDGSNTLTITSPPSSTPGPVNLKLLFPDGDQVFVPQEFSYGPYPQYSILSGASPNGGVAGEISGYGMPANASGGSITVGGNSAAITTQTTQYPPYTGEPFPSTFLQYTIPGGAPGWADLQVQTPNGTGTLPRAVFYAKSVTDYASADSFTAALYDNQRQQVYLSAGDHIDVFSTKSDQYLAPLYPAAAGTKKQFTGLALTPDGSELLAADLLDGSLAVISPDTPAQTYSIPIAAPQNSSASCTIGPLYVAATANGGALVTTGGLPAPACPAQGLVYAASLQSKQAAALSGGACGFVNPPPGFTGIPDAFSVDAPADGSFALIGALMLSKSCIYSVAANSFTVAPGALQQLLGVSVSGDGNAIASGITLADASGDIVGRLDHPVVQTGNVTFYNEASAPAGSLLRPRLNASGSLYYIAYPNYFDIFDVAHATLRIRFSLSETIADTAQPLALDPGGDQVFLVTDKGLTIVDLGTAPLSIGHLSLSTAGAGSQVTVRGSGFSSGTTATIGGQSASVYDTDNSTLMLTVPGGVSGPQDIVLTNPDGATYTLQSGIQVQ